MSDYDESDSSDFVDDVMSAAEVDGPYDSDDDGDEEVRQASSPEPCADEPMTRADEIVDQLLPEGFEWRRLVCTYPKTAMTLSLIGGFFVGRSQGSGLLAGLSGFALGEVSRNVQEFVEDFGA